MFAQIIPADAPAYIDAMIGTWQPVVAALAPILLGLVTSDETRRQIKAGLPVLVAGVLGVISILAEDGMTVEGLIFQVPALWLLTEASFRGLSGLAAVVKRDDIDLNQILMPHRGIIK